MFTIQIRASNDHGHMPPAPTNLQVWQDMERMPEFTLWEEAEDWLTDNKASQLEKFGIEFQIVPK